MKMEKKKLLNSVLQKQHKSYYKTMLCLKKKKHSCKDSGAHERMKITEESG